MDVYTKFLKIMLQMSLNDFRPLLYNILAKHDTVFIFIL